MSVIATKNKSDQKQHWWRREVAEEGACTSRPRPGSICPHCQQGKLDYDSLFNLSCPVCGRVASAGAFT